MTSLDEHQKALLEAAKSGTVADIEKILSTSGNDLHHHLLHTTKDPLLGNTLLHLAAARGSLQITRFLLKQENNSEATTTTTTCNNSINTCNHTGETALVLACQNNHYHAVKELLDHGADANHQNEKSGMKTALFDAVTSVHITKLLLDQGKCDVNHKDRFGNTVLHFAAVKDKTGDVVQVLVDRGAKVNVQNSLGQTPLGNAQKNSSPEVIKILQQKLEKEQPPPGEFLQVPVGGGGGKGGSVSLSEQQLSGNSVSTTSRGFFPSSENTSLASRPSDYQLKPGGATSSSATHHHGTTNQLHPNSYNHFISEESSFMTRPHEEKGSSSESSSLGHRSEENVLFGHGAEENDDDGDGGNADFGGGGGGLQHEDVVCFN